MVGPDYKKPEVSLQERFNEQKEGKEIALDPEWWKMFNDPSLTALIEKAREENHSLKSEIHRIESARALYGLSRAKLLPDIRFNSIAERSRTSQTLYKTPIITPAENTLLRFGFDSLWELDFFGRLRRGKESALAEVESAEANFDDIELTLLTDVAQNYFNLITLSKKIKIAEIKVMARLEKTILILDRFKSGLADKIELKQAEERLAEERRDYTDLQTAFKQTLYTLSALCGQNPENFNITLSSHFPKIQGIVKTGIPSDLLKRRPDIRRAERTLAASTAQIGVAKADYFPTFSLTGNVHLSSGFASKLIRTNSRSFSIGPTIDWSLFNFGRVKNNVLSTKAVRDALEESYRDTLVRAFSDVESALKAYFASEEDFAISLELYTAAKEESILIQDIENAGLKNRIDSLDFLLNQLEKRELLIDSKNASLSLLLSLFKSLGGALP